MIAIKISLDEGEGVVRTTGSCGHNMEVSFSTYRKRLQAKESRCRNCVTNSKRDFTKLNVKRIINEGGGKMLSISDDNKIVRLKYKCGHESEVTAENVKFKIEKYGYLLCAECSSKEHKSDLRESSQEKEVVDFIRRLGFVVKTNYRENYPHGLKIDAYVPELELGFELNGVYWHSEDKGKHSRYHLNKKKYFKEELDIEMFNILDSEWNRQQLIVQSIIRSRVYKISEKIMARKCTIAEISNAEAKSFFDNNHIQGGNGMAGRNYALCYEDRYVSMIAFKKAQSNYGEGALELYRFATVINTSISGGFSKLLKYGESKLCPVKLITYADLRYSALYPEDTVYGKTGFEFKHYSAPNFKLFKDSNTLLDRRLFQKHKLKDILKEYDENLTASENIKKNKYNRIWDCGNMVFEKKY